VIILFQVENILRVELELELKLERELEFNTSMVLFKLTITAGFIYPGKSFFVNNKDVITNGVDT
jgi:hypothetical protein